MPPPKAENPTRPLTPSPEDQLKARLDAIQSGVNELRERTKNPPVMNEDMPSQVAFMLRAEREIGHLHGLYEGVTGTVQVVSEYVMNNSRELMTNRERVTAIQTRVIDIDQRGQQFALALEEMKVIKADLSRISEYIQKDQEEEKRWRERYSTAQKWWDRIARVILILLAATGGSVVVIDAIRAFFGLG